MRLTIHLPWLTYRRRLAVMVATALTLTALALPASAAAPQGIEGEVTVINGLDDPVPVTGEVTADVTGSVDVSGAVTVDNDVTDPVPVMGSVTADVTGSVGVSGTVAAIQSGDWTVGLDSASQGHLSDIDAATAPLSYDADGNLKVNVAAGATGGAEVQTAHSLGSGIPVGIPPSGTGIFSAHGTVTAFAIYVSESVVVRFNNDGGTTTPFAFRVDAGDTFALTFPFPFEAEEATVTNLSDSDMVTVWFIVSGY